MTDPETETEISDFTLRVSEEELADLSVRLELTRWPDQLQGQEWVYGAELGELQDLVSYWMDDFDWRKAEASINQWPQFSTSIQKENVHFIHARSERPDARPLLLTHGWPGSVVEFLDLIEPLTSPADSAAPAFHVVIPSLPGFGLSGPTMTVGISPRTIATMWIELMERLGYDGYIAQGGDWGAIITSWIGELDPARCAGIHINMLPITPTQELLADMTAQEQEMLGEAMAFRDNETGYQAIQSTKPQTLSFGLADSPSGQLAWIYEKFRTWSDCEGDVFSVHDRDRFLTNVALYWFTNTGGSSARIYYEFAAGGRQTASQVLVPTGAALFAKEIYQASRRWAESVFNVVHWSEFPVGGHFAALERPTELITDIRNFVSGIE